MNKVFNNKFILLSGGVLLLVLLITVVVVFGIGKAYKGGLTNILNQPPPPESASIKKKEIKRITIKKNGEAGCLELTPDGVVRVYSVCGEELDQASRLTDPKNILKLFNLLSERELSKALKKGKVVYQLVVETDSGSEIYYVTSEGDNGEDEIIKTVEQIQGDIPHNSPSPHTNPATPPPGSSSYPTTTPFASGVVIPSASPGTGGQLTFPFVCDFSDSGGTHKPYRVSGVVCTTEPSPVP